MISKEKQKFIRSLHKKNNRIESGLFIVEWEKSLIELINSDIKIKEIYLTERFEKNNENIIKKIKYNKSEEKEIEKISSIKSNNAGIAIAYRPENKSLEIQQNDIVVMLDTINDPGNLWTIIRICDWYGINKIVASKETVELTNPKVISSTMWSISRVDMFYTDLSDFLEKNKQNNIYWAFLDWENIHSNNIEFKKPLILVIWNESHWISKNVEKYITKKITIPSFWKAESLNAWVATGIILDNIKRLLN